MRDTTTPTTNESLRGDPHQTAGVNSVQQRDEIRALLEAKGYHPSSPWISILTMDPNDLDPNGTTGAAARERFILCIRCQLDDRRRGRAPSAGLDLETSRSLRSLGGLLRAW